MRRIVTMIMAFALAGCAGAAPTVPAPTGGPSQSPERSTASASPLAQSTPSGSPGGFPSGAPSSIGPAGGAGAATALRGESRCSEDIIALSIAELSWTPAVDRGEEQLVQVTIYTFDLPGSVFSAPLEPTVDQLVFDQLSGQAVHMWRVLTRHDGMWTPSESGAFTGATCVADG